MNNDYNNPNPPDLQNGQYQQNTQNAQNQNYPQNQQGTQNQQGYPDNTYQQPYRYNGQQQQQYQNQNPYNQPPYPPTPYMQPQYMPPQPPPPQPGKGLATASLICSIFSLIIFYTGPFAIVGVILGIIAIITAACAKKKGFIGGMATAGLVMGIIGTVLSLTVFISCLACVNAMSNSISEEIRNYDWDWDDYDWGYNDRYDFDWSDYI